MTAGTLAPAGILGDAPLGQGGQIAALAVSPTGGRVAVLGNHHAISVVDVAAGQIAATLPCTSGTRFVAFADEERVLGFDHRGVVRLALDGTSEVVIARTPGTWDAPAVIDVLTGGEAIALVESRGTWPRDQVELRVQVFRDGAPLATITPALAEAAAGLGLAELEGCTMMINATALAPDGGALVTLATVIRAAGGPGSHDYAVVTGAVLIHATTGRLLRAQAVPHAAVELGNECMYFHRRIAFAPDGRRFATARGTVRVFDADTGEALAVTSLQVAGQPAQALAVAMLAGGELLAVTEGHIGRWTPGASEATAVRAFRERAFVLATAAGRELAAIGDDRALLLFSLPELRPIHEAVGHTKQVGSLAVDATGTQVASADGSSLIVWDVAAGRPKFRIASRCWTGMTFSPDGRELWTALDGVRPHVLDAETGEIRAVGAMPALALQWGEQVKCLHCDEVVRGDEVVTDLVVGEGREARETARLRGPYLRCVPALSRDGRRALVWSDETAYGWDLERGVELWSRPLELVHATLSPDGAFALVTRIGSYPAVLDMATGDTRFSLPEVGRTLSWGVAWSAPGDRLAVCSDSEAVYVFELAGESKRDVIELSTGHRPAATAAAFSGDGTRLVTGGSEGSLRVFELGAGPLIDASPPPPPPRDPAPGEVWRLKTEPLVGEPATVLAFDPETGVVRIEVVLFEQAIEMEVFVDELE